MRLLTRSLLSISALATLAQCAPDVSLDVDVDVSLSTAHLDCCASLVAAGLGDRVVYPNDTNYIPLVDVHWSWVARLEPSCFVLPENAAEVSKVVTTLVGDNRYEKCQFAVRSGGHTLYAGAANIVNGVTVDLSKINAVTYHPENKTVSIYPGARWGKVYSTLDALGVNVAGGRAASVGTAGLMLGGGNSFYSARAGFVCDNVVNYEVVLANGRLIQANNKTNSDLFQALKGGSMNFGIVTRFDLMTLEGADLWGGVVTYPNSTADQQIDAIINFGNNIVNDQYGSAITIFLSASVSNTTTVVNAYDYTKPVVRPAAYNDFLAIPGNTSDSMRITNMTDLTIELEQAPGFRDTWLTGTFKPTKGWMQLALQQQAIMFDLLWEARPHGNFTVQTLFQPIPTIFSKHSVEKGGNVLGLDRFTDNLMLYQLYFAWHGEDQDDLFNGKGHDAFNTVVDYTKKHNLYTEFEYLDYADISQNPLKGYGSANVKKIKTVAKKYDPTGVFQTLVPGGFKISKVA
ncbi:hypothetical protein A1O3_08159 [Capronia epimyces CBS 606.96]|uniref:FAD-binding PCMH-type domain-containing protein n=1 Tax=Capronia epimyces CBS 606.96 TaxID=1182542 RepID=W9YC27_9EURO|nr:uncharacterized protein A1O3_08159 [Capronia epimyces CBS 606.96]EXJ79874.1 hypothetical protein A1O3_08159 [Capronia epimyces CBS 606.96]